MIAGLLSQPVPRRPDIGDIGEIAQHRLQALFHILADAVEQEGGRPEPERAMLARPQQGAVEQQGRVGRGRGHGGWYAEASASGNPEGWASARGQPVRASALLWA